MSSLYPRFCKYRIHCHQAILSYLNSFHLQLHYLMTEHKLEILMLSKQDNYFMV